MNKYTKPKFNMAFLDPISLNAMGCKVVASEEDRTNMEALYGPDWKENTFGTDESCSISIEMYCKFSSGSSTGSSTGKLSFCS